MTTADENLKKVDHIVVLMMENRSFDHMLGFLTIEQGRDDIEGPALAMKNEYRGESFPVHPAPHTTMTKAQDPCHSGWCVDEQLKNKSGGFVSNFMKTRKGRGRRQPGSGDGLSHGRAASRLRLSGSRVLCLRPLVLLCAGRDHAQPLLRARRHLERAAQQPQAEPALQPALVRSSPEA